MTGEDTRRAGPAGAGARGARRGRCALLAAALLVASPAAADLLPAQPAATGDPLPAQPAAAIDPAPFTHVRSITVPPSPGGVARVRLDPAVLAIARADLGDLRVVDASSRQWPYVLRTEVDHEDTPLRVELSPGDRGNSRYRLAPPVAPAAIDAVTIKVDRSFFDRPYRMLGVLPDAIDAPPRRTTTLASGRLTRASGAPDTIVIAFARTRVTAIEVLVEDGDEAPLPIVSATASLPLAELRVVAPPGAYTLLAGDPASEPPRYEIARLRDRVIAADAPTCAMGPLSPSPQHKAPPPRDGEGAQTAVWAAMALAVVGLGWITLRLSRKEQPKQAEPPEGAG